MRVEHNIAVDSIKFKNQTDIMIFCFRKGQAFHLDDFQGEGW